MLYFYFFFISFHLKMKRKNSKKIIEGKIGESQSVATQNAHAIAFIQNNHHSKVEWGIYNIFPSSKPTESRNRFYLDWSSSQFIIAML